VLLNPESRSSEGIAPSRPKRAADQKIACNHDSGPGPHWIYILYHVGSLQQMHGLPFKPTLA
jgi:hypothetical protein